MLPKDTIVRNTLALFTGTAVGNVFSFLLMVYIARTLGDVGVGQYSFLFAYGYLIVILRNPGFGYIIIKDVPANKEVAAPYANNILSMTAITAVVSMVLALVVLIFIKDDTLIIQSFMVVAVIYMIISVGSVFEGILKANERMDLTALIDVIERFVALCVGVVLLYVTRSLLSLVGALLISNLIKYILYYTYAKQHVSFACGIDFALWKRLFVRSLPFALSISFLYVYYRIDTVMLSLMAGDQVFHNYGPETFVLKHTGNFFSKVFTPRCAIRRKTDIAAYVVRLRNNFGIGYCAGDAECNQCGRMRVNDCRNIRT